MKTTGLLLLMLVSMVARTQAPKYKLEVHQYGQRIKVVKGQVDVDKTSFQLVFGFKTKGSWRLISGNNESLMELINADVGEIEAVLSNAAFGGASGYFNESKSIKAYNEKVYTTLEYQDDQHHSFDSIYQKGKWKYGVRTVEILSTKDDAVLIVDWGTDQLILAYSNSEVMEGGQRFNNGAAIQLNFSKVQLTNPLDVRGKTYEEVGEATPQEGCEGCGNLAMFHFLSNGKQVDFLLSGSDIVSFSDYSQKGDQIIIDDELSFTIESNGKVIRDNKSGFTYRLSE